MSIISSPLFAFCLGALAELLLMFWQVRNYKKLLLAVGLFLLILLFEKLATPTIDLLTLPYLISSAVLFLMVFLVVFAADLLLKINEKILFVMTLMVDWLVFKFLHEGGVIPVLSWWIILIFILGNAAVMAVAFAKFSVPKWLKISLYFWFLLMLIFINTLTIPSLKMHLYGLLKPVQTSNGLLFAWPEFLLGISTVFSTLVLMQLLQLFPGKHEKNAHWKERLDGYGKKFIENEMDRTETLVLILIFAVFLGLDTFFHFNFKLIIGLTMTAISIYMRFL